MYYKVTTLIFLTMCLLELSLSVFQEVKSVKSIKTLLLNKKLTEETTVPGQNASFNLIEKLRRVKRNLPMGQRCATNMREYVDRCWPLDTYYTLTGLGEKLKNSLKKENYEEEAIYLMKKWWRQNRHCAKKPCGKSMKH